MRVTSSPLQPRRVYSINIQIRHYCSAIQFAVDTAVTASANGFLCQIAMKCPLTSSPGLDYIRVHPEIDNVLLTGGDPLLLSVRALRDILAQLRQIPHVRIIRIGSKMLAFDPMRILQNLELQQIFREFSQPQQRIYLMTHFDHPRELTAAGN